VRPAAAVVVDRMLIEQDNQILAEAATHIPEEIRATHPEIPWRMIIATRNRLTAISVSTTIHCGASSRTMLPNCCHFWKP
jgi:hypothetical protein